MRWDGDEDDAGGEDDVDDDLDDARDDDDDDDGGDLPFRQVFSQEESSRRRWIFFFVGFRHEAAAKLWISSSCEGFYPGGKYCNSPEIPPQLKISFIALLWWLPVLFVVFA